MIVNSFNHNSAGADGLVGFGNTGGSNPNPIPPSGAVTTEFVNGPDATIPVGGGTATSVASCPPGSVLTGGGFSPPNPLDATVVSSEATGPAQAPTGWQVIMRPNVSGIPTSFHAQAVCAH
ncbi:hypothetical protein [Streptomyces sp. NPDC058255]|uniref:hypothetical protein n=1 Tax=Streptomyces sp. NPDC058255 TaxID=3346407 RepID=UPI0036E8F309